MPPRGTGTRPQDFLVTDLLEWVRDADLALPEFQREYDWENDRVIALVATIMRGWPAGSLLLQELEGQTFFKLRPFDNGPPLQGGFANLVVLDGQQRLTGLFHALHDAGSTVYAIRAQEVTEGASVDQLEEAMHAFDRQDWDATHRRGAFGPDAWIPFYALKSAPDYFAWRDDAAHRSEDPEAAALLISDAYRHGLERFQKYRFPAVIVESGLEPAAIARIFERVNRQGLALKTFDLMVARTFVPDWNLRDRWADARAAQPVLDRFFGEDGMPVIRSIALTTLANVREQAVLNLDPPIVRLQWDDAVEAMARAVAFLEDHCGVADPTWVPYDSMVLTLAAIERIHHLEPARETIIRWFLSRSLGLRYEAAANTVAIEEYRHLQRVLNNEEQLRPVPVSERVLREATKKRQGAIWRGFLCCLSMSGATEVGLGDDEGQALTPTAVLEKAPAPRGIEPPHQLVLNVVLAAKKSARYVSYKGLPAFAERLAQLDAHRLEEVLETQLLPQLNPASSVETLIDGRLHLLSSWLRPRLGYDLERVAKHN
jgi:hypothetical protein